MTYAFITAGKDQRGVREVDLILAGPAGPAPTDIAASNRAAMQALGGVGTIGSRRRKT